MKSPNERNLACSRRPSLMGLALAVALCATAHGAGTNDVGGTVDAKKQGAVTKRDPFWPVGYMPESVKNAAVDEESPTVQPMGGDDWNAAMKRVVINGVSSRNKEYIAVINGRLKQVGDSVTTRHENMVYTWVVESISPPGSVKLKRVSAR